MRCFGDYKILYNAGARTIVLMDAYPMACFPSHLWNAALDEINEDGCVIPLVKAMEHYNLELRVMVAILNVELVTNLKIFSLHDVFMGAIQNPSKFRKSIIFKIDFHKFASRSVVLLGLLRRISLF